MRFRIGVPVATAVIMAALASCTSSSDKPNTTDIPSVIAIGGIPGIDSEIYRAANPCTLVTVKDIDAVTKSLGLHFEFRDGPTEPKSFDPQHDRVCSFRSLESRDGLRVNIRVTTRLDNEHQDAWQAQIEYDTVISYNKKDDTTYQSTLNEFTAHQGQVILEVRDDTHTFNSTPLGEIARRGLDNLS